MQVKTPVFRVLTLISVLIALMLVAAACGDDEDEPITDATPTAEPAATPTPDEPDEPEVTPTPAPPEATPTPEPAATPTPETADDDDGDRMTVRVYLVRGEQLGVASRDIAPTLEVATGAMNELLTGTTGFEEDIGLHSEIPPATRLLGISINDGIATVDLTGDFDSGGGTASMQMRLAQVVFTLTQFDTVDAVLFRLDGVDVDSIGGEGIMVDEPLTRDQFEDQMPPILIESPTPGDVVQSPVRVTGTSNVFEATMQIEIVDNSGLIVYEGFETATSGTGQRGDFDFTVDFDISREGFGSIIMFEYSARDGSRINIVEIPVDFRN